MKRIIEWFIDNPIAANLLMVVILFVGLKNLPTIGKTVLPQLDYNYINISASYDGASPSEVEQQVVIRIEEAIADLEGIEDITSTALEGLAQITVKIVKGFDRQRLLNNIKTRTDALTTLPDDVDSINVREAFAKRLLMTIAIYGNVDESLLKKTTQWMADEFTLLPEVSTASIEGDRNHEMIVEVSENTLRKYNLRFTDIADRIRRSSVNVPGGAVKTQSGNVQVQTRGQAYTEKEFADIVIATDKDGAQLLLGDVARVTDGFEDIDSDHTYNGQPAMFVYLHLATPPDVLDAATAVKQHLKTLQQRLPVGIDASVWRDLSSIYTSRMNLLLKNAVSGLLLVFIVLMLFLTPSLAAWVSVGIATAFIGVFVLLPYTNVTINMLSMYGFLLALGIVVDDAIIVGESVYASQRRGEHGIAAAKSGALLVYKPVLFAVISTLIFFAGMFGLPGRMGGLAYPIAVVVMVCLLFSLIECLCILPSHLSVSKNKNNNDLQPTSMLAKVRAFMSSGMEHVSRHYYQPLLAFSLRNNGSTLVVFMIIFVLVATMFFMGGYLKRSFKVQATSNSIRISAVLAEGASFTDVKRIQQQIENSAKQLQADEKLIAINGSKNFIHGMRSSAYHNNVSVRVRLIPAEERNINIIQVKNRWRELIGPLEGVKEFNLRFTINANAKAIRFRVNVAGNDVNQLTRAVGDVKQALYHYASIYDIEDTLEGSRREIELRLKPHAEVLGLNLIDIARQIRQGFYGEEIQRIPRGTEDVKVMLRYPANERQDVDQIDQLYVRLNDGTSVPFSTVAEMVDIPGYSVIKRENRRRTIIVSAEVTEGTDALAIAEDIMSTKLPLWQQKYPGLNVDIAGSLTDEKQFNSQLILNMLIAVLVSYGLMAIAFRSYWQPMLIITAIPFGFVGAIIGHLIMNETVNIMSMLGWLACSGVVVNDNLVLLDRIHRLEKETHSKATTIDILLQASQDRFRAIILTSLTTFIGLLPIMFETSVQAQFLIPLVISLSCGVLFATLVTLILVPNLFILGQRIKSMQ